MVTERAKGTFYETINYDFEKPANNYEIKYTVFCLIITIITQKKVGCS